MIILFSGLKSKAVRRNRIEYNLSLKDYSLAAEILRIGNRMRLRNRVHLIQN